MTQLREVLIAAYLDYRNDYLTVEKYAEHNGLTVEQADVIMTLGKGIFESRHPDA
jgi:hypothetical protein